MQKLSMGAVYSVYLVFRGINLFVSLKGDKVVILFVFAVACGQRDFLMPFIKQASKSFSSSISIKSP